MEILVPATSIRLPKLSSASSNCSFPVNRTCSFVLGSDGYSSLSPFSSHNFRKSAIVAAKKENKKNNKKPDKHSFMVKPDESTGLFPEAVLLREKKVQEDGQLLPEFADAEERELFQLLNLEMESDLDVDQMRHYEVVYLIHEDHVKDVEIVNSKVQDFIRENKGRVWRFSDWGLRRLAYKIKKAKNAHYILMNFELGANWINDFKSMLDKDERVIRHLVMKKDEAETEDCPPPPEFHSLHAGTDSEEEEEDDEDDMDDEDEDWDDEGEVEGEVDMADGNDKSSEGVIYVEDFIEDYKESISSNKPSNLSNSGKRKAKLKASR